VSVRAATNTSSQTYSMFPSIDTKQGLVSADDRVLVGICLDGDIPSLSVFDQPSPTRALNSRQGGIKFLLEVFQTTVGSVDGFRQLARGGFTTARFLGRKIFPEEAMVEMATTMEVDQGLDGNHGGDVTIGLSRSELVSSGIVTVHVGLVVLAVVQFHDLPGDRWLKGAIIV
jgi:hypothetical protein